MDNFLDRRQFLATLGIGSTTLAGCSDVFGSEDRLGLRWSTGSDWANAQEREGVVSADIGQREAGTLELGYDPNFEPLNSFDAYWPLDENDPNSNTFADELSDFDLSHDPEKWGFTDDIDSTVSGLLGGTSVAFNGDDAILHEGVPIDPSEDWTMGLWVWLDEPEDWSNAMMMESIEGDEPDSDDKALGLLPRNDPPAFKIGSVAMTPGAGSGIDRQQWHFHVIRYEAATNEAQGYLDGEFDYAIEPEDGEDWVPDLHDITLGRRRVGSSNYVFHGRLDSPWMAQGLLPESDIQRLYDTAFEGELHTAAKSSTGEAELLEVAADVSAATLVYVTVHQDTTGDGETDISQTVAIDDGTNSYALDGFEAADDGAYWVAIELETNDTEVTPRIESVAV